MLTTRSSGGSRVAVEGSVGTTALQALLEGGGWSRRWRACYAYTPPPSSWCAPPLDTEGRLFKGLLLRVLVCQ
eukprot:1189809-Prorocentrum_minimum.AAC.7